MKKYYLPIKKVTKQICSICSGTGYRNYKISHNEKKPFICPICGGEGTINKKQQIDIRLPNILFRNK